MTWRAAVLLGCVAAIPLAPGCTCSQPNPCLGPNPAPGCPILDGGHGDGRGRDGSSPIFDGRLFDRGLRDGAIADGAHDGASADLPRGPDGGILWPDATATGDASCFASGCPTGYACAAGGCQPVVCSPHAESCAGNDLVACNATGTSETATACPSGTLCVAGGATAACEKTSCTPGATRCGGSTLYTCNATGTGEVASDCSASMQACVVSGAAAACRPIVCTPGSVTCQSSLLVTCDSSGTMPLVTDCSKTSGETCNPGSPASCGVASCASRSAYCVGSTLYSCAPAPGPAPEDCSGIGQICVQTATGASCQPPACKAGTTSCSGATLVTCNASGSATTSTDCATSSEACVAGAGGGASCQPLVCSAGATSCSGDSTITCNASGTGSTTTPCPSGDICVASGSTASCALESCTPGATSCSGSTLITCNASGTGTTMSDCAAAGGRCVASSSGGASCVANACAPGTTTCSGTLLESCSADGSSLTSTDCAAGGARMSCAPYSGADGGRGVSCQAILCVPGSSACMGTSVVQCNAYGTAETTMDCAAGGYACVDSAAGATCQLVVCTPGATLCSGNLLESCNGSGTAYLGTDCTGIGTCTTSGGSSSCSPAPCTPNQIKCGGDGVSVYQCNASGSGSILIARCDDAIGGACDAAGDCVTSCTSVEKARSNAGCEFWPTHLWNTAFGPFGVVASNPSPTQSASVTLADNHGYTQTQSIPPRGTATFTVSASTDNLTRSEWSNKALHLTSSIPIEAYEFNLLNSSSGHSGGASVLLPGHTLTQRYFTMVYPFYPLVGGSPPSGASYVTVVATADGTTVTVKVTAPTVASPDGRVPALAAGATQTFTLARFDTLEIGTDDVDGLDLTGSEVTASAPVAVFSGSGTSTVPAGDLGGDHLEAQSFPLETWDTSYFIVKTEPRDGETDVYRVLASEDGTIVQTSDPSITLPVLAAGQFAEFSTNEPLRVDASHPILVHHYIPAWGNNTGMHDPTIYTVPPNNGCTADTGGWGTSDDSQCIGDANMFPAIPFGQFRSDYIFYTPSSYAWDFLDVIAPTGAHITLDGAAIPALTPFAGGAYGYARIEVSNAGGPHTILGDQDFGIEVYGYDSYVSYAYPGGLNLAFLAIGK